ncbi:MAG: extracellular solute-binding protein [Oleiphilaceae bacterium]|nr:extracellular solute-binding protein [Oleiphilaceae bacterium]
MPFIKSLLLLCLIGVHLSSQALATPLKSAHGFALHGDLKYPPDFTHLDFVNPDAPKGGTLRLMGFGTFDTLNPYTLKGTSPFNTPGQFMYGFGELNETLLAGTGSYLPSGDEPQSAYGLLAESLRYPSDISWVVFTLREDIHFHDGHKIDAEDVVFSYHTLLKEGHPRFQQQLLGVERVVALSASEVKVTFKEPNRRANILRVGELPVLPQHYWQDKAFTSSEHPPLLSGPYKVGKFEFGKYLELERVPEFWGAKHPLYRGRFNFDLVRIDYYRDQTVAFEAFKANEFDLYYDYTAKNWAAAYDFPAINNGDVIKREISHAIPSGTQAFFFNTRRAPFDDARVREAISLMFDFEWTNKSLFNDAYTRNHSYYPNSDFSARGLPSDAELRLLEPLREHLPHALFSQAYAPSQTKGDGNIRVQMRRAMQLLNEAGWILKDQKRVHAESGKPLEFEILLRQAGIQRVVLPFIKNLERLGITASARLLDTAQYKNRIDHFDFDMMTFVLPQGNAPSYEQRDYFHSANRDTVGSLNYAGVAHPAVDALLEHVLAASSREELVTAMRALDRVLLWQHFTIPHWHLNYHRLAYWDRFAQPETQAPLILGVENWWLQQNPDTESSQ